MSSLSATGSTAHAATVRASEVGEAFSTFTRTCGIGLACPLTIDWIYSSAILTG